MYFRSNFMEISKVAYFRKAYDVRNVKILHLQKCMYWLYFQFQCSHFYHILEFSVVVKGMRKWVWSHVHKGPLHPSLKY